MVEGERPAAVPGIGDDGRPGVVAALGPTRRPGQEDRGNGVDPRVPGRVGIDADLTDEFDLEGGLFAGFSHGRGLDGLAVVDEAAGQRPAGRRVFPFDEDDALDPPAGQDLDDDVDRRERVAELAAGHGRKHLHGHSRGPPPFLSMKTGTPRQAGICPHLWSGCPYRGTVAAGPARPTGGTIGTKSAIIKVDLRQEMGER